MKLCTALQDTGKSGSRLVSCGLASSLVGSAAQLSPHVGFEQQGGCSDMGSFTLVELSTPWQQTIVVKISHLFYLTL